MVPDHRRSPARSRRSGFTLVEILLAMTVLAMLAGGLVAVLLQNRRLAEDAVRESTALSAALGYLEQIKTLPYGALVDAAADPVAHPLVLALDATTPDPLVAEQVNEKRVVVDVDADGRATRFLELGVMPRLRDLGATGPRRAIEITIEYRWRSADQQRPREGSIRTVRAWADS